MSVLITGGLDPQFDSIVLFFPMKIRLNEIPEEGRNYTFTQQTAELNGVLQDLIKNNHYSINLDIKPLNTKDFTIIGSVSTKTPEQCSRCAEDFDFIVDKNIHEILIPNQETDRTGKYAKTSSTLVTTDSNETNISVTEYSKQQFDLGEFLHEAIALEIPFNPYCSICENQNNAKPYIYDEKMSEDVKPNPFQALKGIKLN